MNENVVVSDAVANGTLVSVAAPSVETQTVCRPIPHLHVTISTVQCLQRIVLLEHYQSNLFKPLQPSGHYMYRQFNIKPFYILPTRCIYVFCVDLRTNSDYFTVQH